VVTDVETVALRPVSDMGERGIDELYRQTVGLLNFTGIPQDVFGRQMAFNVVPSSGVDTSRSEGTETRLREETSRLLGMSEAQIALTSAFVSMFHGHALAIRIDFESPVSEQSLMSAMRSARGLRMMEDPAAFSPVDLAGEESVAVLGPWVDSQRPRRVSMWSFCDNLKGGAALNAVRIAERVADLRGART